MLLDVKYTPTTGIFGLAALWLVWRLWTFTIHPRLNKNLPKLIPYHVPFESTDNPLWFGHIVGFFRDGNTLVTRSRLRYASNREPFNIVLAGQNTYIITSAKDTTAVFRNIADLTFDAYVRDMMLRLGASQAGFQVMWTKPSPEFVEARAAQNGFPNPNFKPLIHACEDMFKVQLHPGPEMEVLRSRLIANILERLSWDGAPDAAILDQMGKGNVRTVSLSHWIKHSMLEAATKSFFGEAIFRVEPALLETFSSFDSNSWKFTYHLPRLFANQVYLDKEKLTSAFIRYAEMPLHERSDACWMVRTLETEMRAVGTGDKDIGAYFLMLFWPIQGNPWKVAFWFMAYLLYNPGIKQRIAAELYHLMESQPPLSPIELCKGLNACPLLTASYHETLRLTSSTITVRDVVNDCVIGEKLLQRGSRVLISYRQMFLDKSVFGTDVHSFRPERFLDNPGLAKDPSFRPFGGGLTYCPGRFLAQNEICTVVAILVAKFIWELRDPSAAFPEMDERKPGLGIMFPAEDADVLVNVRCR
ncbi:cytochrome P450 [Lindgomyces ingoldianus]|uniref:Cytochrome P450 n=1 Tax=Lindgomyces ingoldianus TaxID=673940 RepID=A0ACB6RGP9_9PLEO|nr:cytochrome P450 [Lindgomyces ingoldianus]KAF2478396.1 cytochrome P450 [Lindgomyces ingoldianus]